MPEHQTSEPRWLEAIDQLYDAVGREQQLADALGAFRHFFGATSASFFTVADARHPQSSHVGAAGMSDQMLVEYHAHFNVHDAWVNAAVRRSDFATGAVYRGRELVAPDALRRTYFARHFLARHAVTDVLAAVVETSTGAGPTSFVSFHRHRGQPGYTATHVRLLRSLAPHMRQVLRLHRRLAPRLAVGATLHELVRRLEAPLVFLAADGAIVDRNAAASAALAAAQPWLRERAGRLWVAQVAGWQLVEPPAEGGARDVVLHDLVNEAQQCATLELMPVEGAAAAAFAHYPVAAIACLRLGARSKLLALRQVHGLTAAEAKVALQIAEGLSAADIARATGLAITTIRTQLGGAMAKLGADRQAQLVARVLAL